MARVYNAFFRTEKNPSVLYGKWKVLHPNRNEGAINLELWKADSLACNRGYIEKAFLITMRQHPYRYNHRRANVYIYMIHLGTQLFFVRARELNDPIRVTIAGARQMQWVGKWGTDTLRMELHREN